MDSNVKYEAIASIFSALGEILNEATTLAGEANAAAIDGNLNLAIGSALPLEQILKRSVALYDAAIALHRA